MKVIILLFVIYLIIAIAFIHITYNKFYEVEDSNDPPIEMGDINIFRLILAGLFWFIWVIYFFVTFISQLIRILKGEK